MCTRNIASQSQSCANIGSKVVLVYKIASCVITEIKGLNLIRCYTRIRHSLLPCFYSKVEKTSVLNYSIPCISYSYNRDSFHFETQMVSIKAADFLTTN